MAITDFKNIESLLQKLLNSIDQDFNKEERSEVQDLIDAGAHGEALETFTDIIVEEDKRITKNSLAIIRVVATAMSIDENYMREKLKQFVK